MKRKRAGIVVLAVVIAMSLVFVGQAFAGGTTDAIIEDARDGVIDGNWTAGEIQAALDYLKNNPVLTQYSDMEGVLEDYVGSSQAPGTQGGQLAFTGGEVYLAFGLGAALVAAGVVLRRRSRTQA